MKPFGEYIQPFVVTKGMGREEDFGKEVLEHQQWVVKDFPARVRESHMHLWYPGDPVSDRGRRFLIGVAMWSGYDLVLLDVLNDAVEQGKITDRIDVSDCGQLQSRDQFRSYIPGLGEVFQFPVLGVWEFGTFTRCEQGFQARSLILSTYGLENE